MKQVAWRAGIDVGSHSVGLVGVVVDEMGFPKQLIGAKTELTDSGISPDGHRAQMTRLAQRGSARRERRRLRRRRKRLKKLAVYLEAQGWQGTAASRNRGTYDPWIARQRLAEKKVAADELGPLMVLAVEHIARHRGWRNPYTSARSLLREEQDSDFLRSLKDRLDAEIAGSTDNLTAGQCIARVALTPSVKVRGDTGVLAGRLHQSDHARELERICCVQDLPEHTLYQLVDLVFDAESPKGAARLRVGADALQPDLPRCPRAHSEFQRYRMLTVLSNLRVNEAGQNPRRLSPSETQAVYEFLRNSPVGTEPSWEDVARVLGVTRSSLRGTAQLTDDGERAGGRPPIDATSRLVLTSGIQPLTSWWQSADSAARDALVEILDNVTLANDESPSAAIAQDFLGNADPETLTKIDELRIPSGRAAYSVDTLRRLSDHILGTGDDLTEARQSVFGVPPDWSPPADPIHAPVGNPSVDRVVKVVHRWLTAMEREFGPPRSVTVEHVRAGFVSQRVAHDLDRRSQRRHAQNERTAQAILSETGLAKPTASDRMRYRALHRQNCRCLYCGTTITFQTAQMDHIVPRVDGGSSNRSENLVATCGPCNSRKGRRPFASWASADPEVDRKQVLDDIRFWQAEPGMTQREHRTFLKEVRLRLTRRESDPPIDSRSFESIAWMADVLRHRISGHYAARGASVPVQVFRGRITAEARYASGVERRILLVGTAGKSRLDRRHHIVDAGVIAMMTPAVAQALALRIAVKEEQRILRTQETWRSIRGRDHPAYDRWVENMGALVRLLNASLTQDQLPVVEPLRLRLSDGRLHLDQPVSLDVREVRSAMTPAEIDRASSEALWCALTRSGEYDPAEGLPANPERYIRVHDRLLGPSDTVSLFASKAASIKVRGGSAEVGNSIHHARIYRLRSSRVQFGMIRVFTPDLRRHAAEDLFAAPLLPQSLSVRYADPTTRRAFLSREAEYLGWLVVGDEIVLHSDAMQGAASRFNSELPCDRWSLTGLGDRAKLTLRPRLLSGEGLADPHGRGFVADDEAAAREILSGKGWRVAVNKAFGPGRAAIVRRDALGRPRYESDAHLPVCWASGSSS